MFSITKDFSFEYAHRVYTQDVQEALACEKAENSCRHIHGHSGKLTVTLECDTVDQRGFVLDYKELGFIKRIVKEELDHKFIIGVDDPMNVLFDMIDLQSHVTRELKDSFTMVPIIPTSENLAEYYFDRIDLELKALYPYEERTIKLVSVSWSETPSSTATYTRRM